MTSSKYLLHHLLAFYFFLHLSYCFHKEMVDEQMEKDNGEENAYDNIVKINAGHTELFEADISVESYPENIKTPYSKINSNLLKRGLRREAEYLWVERVIPYELTPAVVHGKEVIESAFREIEQQACIKFKKREKEKHWVKIVDEGACFSGVGRAFWREGSQKLSLARGCMQKGTVMHELLHTLGFWHEQSRPDRDKFVEIFWENVKEGEEHNFAKYSVSQLNSQQIDYDINSIMHYGKYSFSKNGEPTIKAINDPSRALGQRVGLSKEDAIQLNLLYRCKDVGQTYTSWSDWTPCDSDFYCKSNRQRFCSHSDRTQCEGADLYGIHTEYRTCPDDECYKPINGHWNRWAAWTTCDKSCGTGRKTRTRKCDDPKPKNEGRQCTGESSQTTDCFIIPCGLGQDDCQFDAQNMCFWKDVSSISYKWQRRRGTTPSKNTGPNEDHSTGKGYYIFTESSAPAETGMKANLISKIFPSTRGRCLTFFYSMHGANMGKMRVYVITEGSGAEKLIWEKDGPQGEGWYEGEVVIQNPYAYRIKFQGERGVSFLGDMALDDIQFKVGSCGGESLTMILPTTIKPTRPKTTIAPINGICGIPIKPLGCFAEIPHQPALPVLLDNHRGPGAAYHGKQLLWDKFPESLNSLLCDCLHIAKQRGIRYIGLQYFGECWGLDEGTEYNRYGISTLCVDGKYKPCYHQNYQQVCVGKAMTNYIYEVV